MEDTNNMIKNKISWSILSIGTITVLGSMAVSPALAGIKNAFPNITDSTLQLVLIIPPLFIVPVSLVSSRIIKKFGAKNTLILGLVIYLVGGLGAGLMPNFYSMLIFRALLGVSCGLLTPLAQILISIHFSEILKVKMKGYPASASYLMGIISSIVVGYLSAIHWRLAFIVYSVAFVVLYLNLKYLPEDREKKMVEESISKKIYDTKEKTTILIIIISAFFINLAFYTFSSIIALFIKNEGYGHDSLSGKVVSFFMLAGFLTGLKTEFIRRRFKSYTNGLAALAMGSGYLILSFSDSIPNLYVAGALIGSSYSIFYATIFLSIDDLNISSAESINFISYVTAAMFAGQAASVQTFIFLEKLFNHEGFRFRFKFLGAILLSMSLVSVFITILKKLLNNSAT